MRYEITYYNHPYYDHLLTQPPSYPGIAARSLMCKSNIILAYSMINIMMHADLYPWRIFMKVDDCLLIWGETKSS